MESMHLFQGKMRVMGARIQFVPARTWSRAYATKAAPKNARIAIAVAHRWFPVKLKTVCRTANIHTFRGFSAGVAGSIILCNISGGRNEHHSASKWRRQGLTARVIVTAWPQSFSLHSI